MTLPHAEDRKGGGDPAPCPCGVPLPPPLGLHHPSPDGLGPFPRMAVWLLEATGWSVTRREVGECRHRERDGTREPHCQRLAGRPHLKGQQEA